MNAMTDINPPSIFNCTPMQAEKFIIKCLYANLVPFILSSPGLGKSAIVQGIGKKLRLKVIDQRIAASVPEDFNGLPRFKENGRATFSPFDDLFPLEDAEIPEGYDGWLLFLDEFNSGMRSVFAACYKLLLDRMVGQHKLHPNVRIVLAGNLSTDKAIVNDPGTAIDNRVCYIHMVPDADQHRQNVLLKQNYDERITGFLSFKPEYLADMRPGAKEKSYCSPRSWEAINRLIEDEDDLDPWIPLLAGTITSGVAVEFAQYTKVYKNLITIEDVIRDPLNAMVPRDTATRWAITSHLITKVNEDNASAVVTYMTRLGDLSFRLLFYRAIQVKYPDLIPTNEAVRNGLIEISRYLHDPI